MSVHRCIPDASLAAILAADVVGYSRVMGTDEEGTLARLKAHRDEVIDSTIGKHKEAVGVVAGELDMPAAWTEMPLMPMSPAGREGEPSIPLAGTTFTRPAGLRRWRIAVPAWPRLEPHPEQGT